MAKDPALLFYTSDFLTGTMLMTDAQVGQYIRLLCLQHQKGHLHESDLKKICGGDSEVMSKFVIDDEGLYYNIRLDNEANRRANYAESRRKNAAGNKKHMQSICKAYADHMETETVTITDTNNKDNKRGCGGKKKKTDPVEPLPGFEAFWEAYPRKVAKQDAIRAYNELAPGELLLSAILAAIVKQKGGASWCKIKYIPYPATWLRGRRWEDENGGDGNGGGNGEGWGE
jgi:hypothetical protein